MEIFEKKLDREIISELLMEVSGRLITKGVDRKSSAELVRLTVEYNDILIKNSMAQDRFLLERLEKILDIIQKDEKNSPDDNIRLYVPDIIKNLKIKIKNDEYNFMKSKEKGAAIIKILEDTMSTKG
jgi:hypothetical protein